MAAWVVAPIALVLSRAEGIGGRSTASSVVYLMVQATVLYAPFWLSGRVADLVNGQRMPFVRWYLAVASAFAVHHVFTATLHLAVPRASDDFGRTATLYLVNAVIVGIMAVVANEASSGLQISTDERAWQQRQLQDDAYLRSRRTTPVETPMMSVPEIGASALARPTVPTIPAAVVVAPRSIPAQVRAPQTPPAVAAPPSPPVPSAPAAHEAPVSARESAAAAAAVAAQMAPVVRVAPSVPVIASGPVVPTAADVPLDPAPISPVPDSMAPVSISSLPPLAPRKPAPPTAPAPSTAPAPAVTTQEPEPEPAPAPVVRASNGLPSLSALISSATATREP
jgi:hypothetical protein